MKRYVLCHCGIHSSVTLLYVRTEPTISIGQLALLNFSMKLPSSSFTLVGMSCLICYSFVFWCRFAKGSLWHMHNDTYCLLFPFLFHATIETGPEDDHSSPLPSSSYIHITVVIFLTLPTIREQAILKYLARPFISTHWE